MKRLMRNGKKRGRQTGPLSDTSEVSDDFPEPGPSKPKTPPLALPAPTSDSPLPSTSAVVQTTNIGSALARDASGNVIAPKVVRKKKKSKAKVFVLY